MARRRATLIAWVIVVTGAVMPITSAQADVTNPSVPAISATASTAFNGPVVQWYSSTSGPYNVHIDWGDGTQSDANSQSGTKPHTATGSHTWTHEGTYTVAVTVVDLADKTQATATGTATVSDANPSVSAAAVSATAGQPFSGRVAAFTDSDQSTPASGYTATVAWGDGVTSAGTVAANGAGGFDVSASHTWSAAGSYPLSVTVHDAGGGSGSGSSAATVAAAPTSTTTTSPAPPPPGPPPPAPFDVSNQSPSTGQAVTMDGTGLGSGCGATDYRWDLDGNGTLERDSHRNGRLAVTYGTPGTKTVTLDIHCANGSDRGYSASVVVSGSSNLNCGSYCHLDYPTTAPRHDCHTEWLRQAYVQADRCFTASGHGNATVYTVSGRVRVNGFDLWPVGGGTFTVRPGANGGSLTSSGQVSAQFGEIVLFRTPIRWTGLNGDGPATSPNYAPPLGPAIEGLTMAGHLYFTFDGLQGTFQGDTQLPAGLGGNSALLSLTTDANHPAGIDDLHLSFNQASLDSLPVKNVDLHYNGPSDLWSGAMDVNFGSFEVNASMAFNTRPRFNLISTSATVSGLAVQLYGGVYLDALSFNYDSTADTIGGGVNLDYGNIQEGGQFLVSLNGTMSTNLHGPTIVKLDPVELRVLGKKIANANLIYDTASDYIGAHADVRLSLDDPSFWADGHRPQASAEILLNGFFNGRDHTFLISGSGDVWMGPHLGAAGLISNLGASACVTPIGGVGYTFATHHVDLIGGTCDMTQWTPVDIHGGVRAAAAGQTFTVPAGEPAAAFKLVGTGAPPSATLTGPGGVALDVTPDRSAQSGPAFGFANPADASTYFVVRAPRAGRWTLTPDAGSAPVTAVASSHALPDPKVAITVSGRGAIRVLHYRVSARLGQGVSFYEAAGHVSAPIGTARGARGTLRFTPAYGPAGTRQIVAALTTNRLPWKKVTVGHYRAPAPVSPGRARALRFRQRKRTLTVSWRGSRGSHPAAWQVTVAGPLRRHLVYLLAGGRHSVAVPNVIPADRPRITITALGTHHDHGPRIGVVAPQRR